MWIEVLIAVRLRSEEGNLLTFWDKFSPCNNPAPNPKQGQWNWNFPLLSISTPICCQDLLSIANHSLRSSPSGNFTAFRRSTPCPRLFLRLCFRVNLDSISEPFLELHNPLGYFFLRTREPDFFGNFKPKTGIAGMENHNNCDSVDRQWQNDVNKDWWRGHKEDQLLLAQDKVLR